MLARLAVGNEGGATLARFWDMSMRRAKAVAFLAGRTRACRPDIAHTFGLFCDIGVPLLTSRFPDYAETYLQACNDDANAFTAVEEQRHSTNHAAIGCLLARNWGLTEEVSLAILLHHDYSVLDDPGTDDAVRSLVALFLLAENAIQKLYSHVHFTGWEQSGPAACRHLGLTTDEAVDLLEEVYELFDDEV